MPNAIRWSVVFVCVASAASLAGCSGSANHEQAEPAANATYEQAEAAVSSGDYEKAVEILSVLAKTEGDPFIYGNRANCYVHLGNLNAALADFGTAIDMINSQSSNNSASILPNLYHNRGQIYYRTKQYPLAVADFEKTIETQPDFPSAKNDLAWLLATTSEESVRNPERALELANQELARDPEDPAILDTVAACYAAAGDFTRAAATQEKAISLSAGREEKQRLSARLELYRNRQPFVESE
jgi:tetratricopeptide (TPR) repeat protein